MNREQFVSKNITLKYDKNKSDYAQIPPESLDDIVQVLTYGAKKYASYNWTNGTQWSRYFSACMRHLWSWWRGEDNDKETGISHLAHAGCCVLFLIYYAKHCRKYDDRHKIKDIK